MSTDTAPGSISTLQQAANGDVTKAPYASAERGGDKQPKPTPAATAPTPGSKSGAGISAAEAKRLKKEEKAARRAKEKETRATPPQIQKPGSGTDRSKAQPPPKGDPVSGGQRSQPQKHRPSISKPMPQRPIKEVADGKATKSTANKQVALFAHLYGHPRRSTLDSAGKDVHPAILALGLKISSYNLCGSTARCVAMLLAFRQVIESYTTPPGNSLPRHLTSHLSPQIEYLVSCRPLSTSMGNAIRWLKLEINDVDPDTDEDRAKADLCEAIDIFIRDRITVAGQVIAEAAQEKIQNGDVVLTFAKSKVVQQTLVEALKKGRRFKVIVVDSRPLREGRNLAKSLAEIGLDVTYSTIHSIGHLIDGATKVFLGAHSMLGNGRLYSRAGSAMVAMLARDTDIPVIICCESIKFTDKVALDSIVTNEIAPPEELVPPAPGSTALEQWKTVPHLQLLNLMYDVTPAEYISTIVTEHGSLPPSSVPVVHRLSTNT